MHPTSQQLRGCSQTQEKAQIWAEKGVLTSASFTAKTCTPAVTQ